MRRLSNTTSTADDDGGGGDKNAAVDAAAGVGAGDSRDDKKGWLHVCPLSDVADGTLQKFEDHEGGRRMLVANQGGVIRATDLMCTHEDADLSTGFLGPDGVRCPLHLSVFDLESGCPLNPPAEKPVQVYNVRVDDGQIYVEA